MSGLRLKRDSRGDTIVEVLISIAILSMVLTISYALSNRNSAYIRQAQERSEAQKLGEKQLELLRAYFETEDISTWTFKCFNEAGQPTANLSDCQNIKGLYGMNIAQAGGGNDAGTYTITASWPALTGNTTQTMQLSYKLPGTNFDAIQFDPGSDSYIDVAVKKIPLKSGTGDRTPLCSSSATLPVSSLSTTLNIPGGGTLNQPTGSNGIAQYGNLTEHGYETYSASLNPPIPTGHEICTGSGSTNFQPGVNPTINLKIRPVCNVTTEIVGWNPVYSTGGYWAETGGYWAETGGYWAYDTHWNLTQYWPAGYTPINNPATIFVAGDNRLDLYGTNYNSATKQTHYFYHHYYWVRTYTWTPTYTWITYTYQSGETPIYGPVWHCP